MIPSTELLIARHGEAWCNLKQIVGGPRGCRGLTDTGRTQVRRLAEWLYKEHKHQSIDAFYTTPLRRVQESATIVAKTLDLNFVTKPDLRETDYGEADGKPWMEVVTVFGRIPNLEPDRPIAPGAETWSEYLHRSTTALRKILTYHAGQRILIIGHGETVVTAVHLLLNLPGRTRSTAGFAAYPAGVTVWKEEPISWTQPGTGRRWALVRHNDTRHLDNELT